LAALHGRFTRGTRVVTAGADVDGLISLRQALGRLGVSVSMAWDAKQAREMLGVVRPHAVVVDMSMPKRDGCAIVAAVAALDPVPLIVVVTSAGDPAVDFSALLADPPRDTIIRRLAQVVEVLAGTTDETLPRVGQKSITKLQYATGPRWVG